LDIKHTKKYAAEKKAFTIIEALVLLFIFSLITVTFYRTFSVGMNYIIDAKNRLGAIALAREKMEIVRNLEYDSIGTVNGIPSGEIADDETVAAQGKTYAVNTFVQYVDDPLDGELGADAIPNDYKRVKIDVSWIGVGGQTEKVFLVSRFVPYGLEKQGDGGILSINILDGGGNAVPQAHIHLVNNEVSPARDINTETDNGGNLIFPDAPLSVQGYQITVSKSGYETVVTLDPASVYYVPMDANATVVAGLNTKTISIDPTGDLKISSEDYQGNSLPNVSFHLEGGRILGMDNLQVPPVTLYAIDEDGNTGADGSKQYAGLNPGIHSNISSQYSLSLKQEISGYTFVATDPPAPFSLEAGGSTEVKMKFANNDLDSLVVNVKDNSSSMPIGSASVRLYNGADYDKTLDTDSSGRVFFPSGSDSLAGGSYSLDVKADGYIDQTMSVNINKFTSQEVKMSL